MMVEVEKLGRRTNSMVWVFRRLLAQSSEETERKMICDLGRNLITDLTSLLETGPQQEAGGS